MKLVNKRRSEREITSNILNLSIDEINKTKLLSHANLNSKLLNKYLASLTDNGFLEKQDGRYKTTEKGAEFLNMSEKLNGLLKEPTH